MNEEVGLLIIGAIFVCVVLIWVMVYALINVKEHDKTISLISEVTSGHTMRIMKLEREMAELREQIADEREDAPLSAYEQERLRREKEHDLRINELKTELHGTEAEELHPQVKNLPHDSIKDNQDYLPDVEYAE